MKILTDEAVNSWKYNIHYCILNSCGKLLQLCALHMKRDNPYLLELLAIVLDPDNKFNTFNCTRQSDLYTYVTEPIVDGQDVGLPQIPNATTNPVGLNPIGNPAGATVGVGPSTVLHTNASNGHWGVLEESKVFAKSPSDAYSPRGWLVDMINR